MPIIMLTQREKRSIAIGLELGLTTHRQTVHPEVIARIRQFPAYTDETGRNLPSCALTDSR